MVIAKGADRICINNLFMTNSSYIKNIAYSIGSQSLLVSINIKKDNKFYWYNYLNKKLSTID